MGDTKSILISVKRLSNKMQRLLSNLQVSRGEEALTGMQCGVLVFIREYSKTSDVFQKDIEKEFNIRGSTATGILQLMEKNNLIERVPVDYDARLKKIILTEKGINTREEVDQWNLETEKRLTKNLTPDEIETFLALIDKISKGLD
ncbi:MarR family winged helix-turn-helix transcriptional regulator [Clostridium sp. Marseille-P299]|uniref:MarR family winged helix-turn-helix transcriptional regulator n=1 Tax=Clostridium sp. Marseille-P299 TaxID=1805477 RepID=UPI00083699B0|nr:MarR family winged helix-turn-helix transcriptional regulator [Clostridium sp. Marseille-P299]